MYKYFSNLTKMVPIHQILKLILIPLRKSPIFDPFVVRENVKIWLKMFWISLSKLGFTLKEIDLSVFSSLQRHFLHLPDFLLFSRASAPAKRAQRSPIRKRKLKPIDPKKKSKAKLIIKSLYCVFIRVFRLNIPAANLQHTGSSPAVFAVNFFFKPIDVRKFGYDVRVLRLSVQTLG